MNLDQRAAEYASKAEDLWDELRARETIRGELEPVLRDVAHEAWYAGYVEAFQDHSEGKMQRPKIANGDPIECCSDKDSVAKPFFIFGNGYREGYRTAYSEWSKEMKAMVVENTTLRRELSDMTTELDEAAIEVQDLVAEITALRGKLDQASLGNQSAPSSLQG